MASINNTSDLGITVRHLDFEFQGVPKYYFDNNPLLSSLLSALSLTFPPGERFFVYAVRNVRDRVRDPLLQKKVGAFIGQEAVHSHAHDDFNHFIEHIGLDIHKTVTEEEKAVAFLKKKLNAKQQLAITCALEHFTAIIAHYLLTHPDFSQKLDPKIAKLWMWHALEETEHKAVAFDVYKEIFADQKTRKLCMRIITFTFIMRITQLTMRLLWQDPVGRTAWREHLAALSYLKHMIRTLAPEYVAYYQDSFHPNQQDSSAITHEWQQRLFSQTEHVIAS